MNEPESPPTTMLPRSRCLECGRRRVLKQGYCRDCREVQQDSLRETTFAHYIRLDAGRTYHQWADQAGPNFEILLRRAYLDGNLVDIIEWAYRQGFEQGVLAYPSIAQKLEHDLESL